MKITDEMIEALRRGRDAARDIAGFHYSPHYVIRDLRKAPGEQEVWRCHEGRDSSFNAEIRRRKDAEEIAAVAPLILEEAAKVAEAFSSEGDMAEHLAKIGIAAAIRALKEQTNGQT